MWFGRVPDINVFFIWKASLTTISKIVILRISWLKIVQGSSICDNTYAKKFHLYDHERKMHQEEGTV